MLLFCNWIKTIRKRKKRKYLCMLAIIGLIQLLLMSRKKYIRKNERFLDKNLLNRNFSGNEVCGNIPCFGEGLCSSRSHVSVKLNHSSAVVEKGWFVMTGVMASKYGVKHNTTFKTPFLCPSSPCDVTLSMDVFAGANLRATLCQKFYQKQNCDFKQFLNNWSRLKRLQSLKGRLDPDVIRKISPPFLCATQRLADRVVRRVHDLGNDGTVLLRHHTDEEKAKLLLLCKMSPETVVQKLFPSSEGWPFPLSYGRCGNVIVHATPTVGTLYDVYHQPWKIRLDVAIQILNLAHHLSENDSKFTFLLHKLTPLDFGLSRTGRLRVRNAGDVIILDQADSKVEFVEVRHKKMFVIRNPNVCGFTNSDVNYYAVCRNILGGDWMGFGEKTFKRGLLHDPQELGDVRNQIFVLLDICIRGSDAVPRDQRDMTSMVRLKAAGKLRKLLLELRECDARFAYRYPECELMSKYSDVYRLPSFELEWLV